MKKNLTITFDDLPTKEHKKTLDEYIDNITGEAKCKRNFIDKILMKIGALAIFLIFSVMMGLLHLLF